MAIAQAGVIIVPTEVETSLPSIIKGLRLAAGTCFDPRRERGRYAIQRAVYLLRTLGYGPTLRYIFKEHDGGPISNELARELERLDGSTLRSARPDMRIAEEYPLLKTALNKGDQFVQVLGFSLSVRMRNPGFSRDELIEFQSELDPSLAPYVADAWEFMEVMQWPLTIR
ncbi:MAG: hypothetical protein WCK39_06015 [Methanomassiliicoccales archaeon]